MDYSKLTPLLVEAIKTLKAEKDAEISELKARLSHIDALKEENEELRRRIEKLEAVLSNLTIRGEGVEL